MGASSLAAGHTPASWQHAMWSTLAKQLGWRTTFSVGPHANSACPSMLQATAAAVETASTLMVRALPSCPSCTGQIRMHEPAAPASPSAVKAAIDFESGVQTSVCSAS